MVQISRLEIFAPRTEDLVRMLMVKWATVDKYGRVLHQRRHEKAWEQSLAREWAVIKMGKDEQAMKERGEPDIGHLEEEDDEEGVGVSLRGDVDVPTTNVAELLARLGMRDVGAVAQRLWDCGQ
jgi:hypothetical protein